MNNTSSFTSSYSSKPTMHFIHGTHVTLHGKLMHSITLFMVAWDRVTVWATSTTASFEEAMRVVKPNINTQDWEYLHSGTIEEGRKLYSNLLKDKCYKPVKP